MKNENIIAIIPARGGSKGIPGKNIMSFAGKPLLAWSIRQAKESKYIRDVFVTSDNNDILNVADKYEARLIKRPKILAGDKAATEDALLHALDTIESSGEPRADLVVFLQATSPLRTSEDIDQAIDFMRKKKGDSLFSAALLEDYCLWKQRGSQPVSFNYDYKKRGRRQEREKLFLENGSIYIFRPDILRRYHNRLGGKILIYLMEYWKSYEIDQWGDIPICEYFMKNKILKRRR